MNFIFIIIILLGLIIGGLGFFNYNLIKSLRKERDQLDKTAKILIRRDLALSDANEHLQEMDKLKSEFILIAAHQLRTPLSGVKWVFSILLNKHGQGLTELQRKMLKKGYKTNERIIRLANDLLSVIRIEEERFGYKFKTLNLVKFIKEIVQDNYEKFKKKGLRLRFLEPDQEFPKCKIDPQSLRLAIQNILDNAHDYTLKGFVKISIKQREKEFLVKIKDTGVGVPPEQESRLFTKFFRGSNIMHKGLGTEGTGLGLYIVKNIIEKHGGKAWLVSQLNKGTVFYFTLPV